MCPSNVLCLFLRVREDASGHVVRARLKLICGLVCEDAVRRTIHVCLIRYFIQMGSIPSEITRLVVK